MGCFKVGVGLLSLLLVPVAVIVYKSKQVPELPDIKLKYWGPGPAKPDDTKIRPFKISIPQAALKELKEKLDLTRSLTPPFEGVGFQYGMNTDFLKKVLEHWKTQYNWTERQTFLNKYPHYKTQIGGLDIHFLHVKPSPEDAKGKKVLPLLMVHGWPGSFREFYEVIPLLSQPRDGVLFELVIPSLPGFGFSQAAAKEGLGIPQIATIFGELMNRLGHQKFYYQGGDWGAHVGLALSVLYPQRVLAFHCNFCGATTPSARLATLLSWLFPSILVEKEKQELYKSQFFDTLIVESGYFHIQATKPDTVGVALSDSPAGLAAYILEKFSTGTNKKFRELPGGGLENFDKDHLIDNVMIYWLTKSITTSVRIYSQYFLKETHSSDIAGRQVEVPTHCARFPNEIMYYPKWVLDRQYSTLTVSDFETGGHFAAFEVPALFANDVWAFFLGQIRNQGSGKE